MEAYPNKSAILPDKSDVEIDFDAVTCEYLQYKEDFPELKLSAVAPVVSGVDPISL